MKTGKKTKRYSTMRWYGFDVDGTIADNSRHGWTIDAPVKPMVDLMKEMHEAGCDVRILSGRTGDFRSDEEISPGVKELIWDWCDRHLGFRPALTGRKDSMMEALYDDRAKQVVCNKGVLYEDLVAELAEAIDEALADPSAANRALTAAKERLASLGLQSQSKPKGCRDSLRCI